MKVAVVADRLSLIVDGSVVDVKEASGGRLSSHVADLYGQWERMLALAEVVSATGSPALDLSALQLPVPAPRQVFGVGLNYADHATESAMELPKVPLVFPKFVSSIAGPNEVVRSNASALDWEAELVVVIGRDCRDVPAAHAWSVVAGLTVGQDLSDRDVQFEGGANPQFGLGKSAPGFGPIGPWVTTVDEVDPAVHLDISGTVNGDVKQHSNTEHLIFDVPTLVAYLSSRVQLLAGDLIFTGTPSGVGWGREPKEFLRAGDVVTTTIAGLGTLTTRIEAR